MDFLKSYASKIESELQQLELPDEPKTLYQPQRYILAANGKRIRPILALMGCGLCGKSPDNAIPVALAVELVHNFTLMHDDIMDQAKSRRGQLSVHAKWDTATAILAGDSMFVQAMRQIQYIPDSADIKAIYNVLLDTTNKVCEGQALDMEFEKRTDVTSDEYLEMISGKTSALISGSLKMGGLTAGALADQLKQLEIIGNSLGIAFQIQDDLLDVVADPDKFGKRKGGDIFEGKKTYLMVKTLECCTDTERQWLTGLLKNRPLEKEDVNKVIELYRTYKIAELSEKLIDSYYQKAENALNQFDDSIYKGDLVQLINYLKKRDF